MLRPIASPSSIRTGFSAAGFHERDVSVEVEREIAFGYSNLDVDERPVLAPATGRQARLARLGHLPHERGALAQVLRAQRQIGDRLAEPPPPE
jgi:hypothetical protein